MTSRDFPRFDETTSPTAAREHLARSKRTFGAVPEPLARYASSPAMLAFALSGLETFETSSLAPLEREVLAMTMSRLNGCELCLGLHRRLLVAQKAPPALIDALEAGQSLAEPRLEALRRFVLALVSDHGDVAPEVWSGFRQAGYSHAQALDVAMGVAVYTLTTLANRLTEASGAELAPNSGARS